MSGGESRMNDCAEEAILELLFDWKFIEGHDAGCVGGLASGSLMTP
jgi:hypothetical protein